MQSALVVSERALVFDPDRGTERIPKPCEPAVRRAPDRSAGSLPARQHCTSLRADGIGLVSSSVLTERAMRCHANIVSPMH